MQTFSRLFLIAIVIVIAIGCGVDNDCDYDDDAGFADSVSYANQGGAIQALSGVPTRPPQAAKIALAPLRRPSQ